MRATADLTRVKEAAASMPQKLLPSKAWSRRVAALTTESNRAFLIALRILDKPALAEEAVQDAYARMLEHPVDGLVGAQASLYLFKTVRSVALNLSMSSQSRKQREEKHAVGIQETQPSPADAAEKAEAIRAARAALNQLPLEEREAVSLCCEQDLTRHAAAEVLGVPERTLAYRVERGLASLQRILAVQGFASVTAVAVSQGLRDVGVPPAPAALTEALSNLTTQAANLARTSVRASVRTAKKTAAAGASGKAAAIGIVALGTIGIWWLATQQPVVKPAPPIPAAVPSTPAPAPKPVEAQLPVRWGFEKGPAPDLEVVDGTWSWQAPSGEMPGRMIAGQDKEVAFLLPTQIPPRLVVVDLKLHYSAPSRKRHVSGLWVDGKQPPIPDQNLWYYAERTLPYGAFSCQYYFLGRHVAVVGNSRLLAISEYPKAYPASKLRFMLQNFAVEEIELRSISTQEVPAPLRDLPALLRELGPSRVEGPKAPPYLIGQ